MKKIVSLFLSSVLTTSVFVNCFDVVYATDAEMVEIGVVEDYDFQDQEPREFTEAGYFLDDKLWIRMITPGDSIAVIEEDDGNKALKITRKLENLKTGSSQFMFVFDKAYTGKIKVNFRVKIGNDNGGCGSFGGFGSSSSTGYTGAVNNRLYANYWWCKNSGTEQWTNWKTWGDTWFPAEMVIDIENGTYHGEVYRNYGLSNQLLITKDWTFSKNDVKDIKYLCLANIGTQNVNADAKNDTEYYFDDIRVTYYDYPQLEVKSVSKTENISPDTSVILNFSEAISEESVNKDNFIIYEDNKRLENYSVISNGEQVVLTSDDGWDYNREYSVVVKKDIVPLHSQVKAMSEDHTFSFNTESIIGDVNVSEGKRYNSKVSPEHKGLDGVDYKSYIKYENEEFSEYDYSELDKTGRYVLKIVAEKNSKTEEKEINFTVIGETAPYAENVVITGEAEFGKTLEGSYDFIDENEDVEAESSYRWLLADTEDGKFEEVVGEGKSISVDEKMIDKYIKFEVTPRSNNEPSVGKSVMSAAVTGPFRPSAKDINIEKNGEKLTVSYSYIDNNGDFDEGDTRIQWYRSNEKNGNYKAIDKAVNKEYILTNDDTDCFIMAKITPISLHEPYEGKQYSSKPVSAGFAPEAKNLSVIGKATVGQTIGAAYTFYDENGDEEENSIIKWYVGDDLVYTGPSLDIIRNYVGKNVYFEVTPISKEAPQVGKTVKSPTVTVFEKASGTSSGGGGGRTGGTGGKPSVTVPVKPNGPSTSETNNGEQNKGEDKKSVFSDITSHWAKADIEELYEKGIVNGVTDDSYAPENNVTRAQIASMLYRALKIENGEYAFEDVNTDDWYYEAVSALANAGLIQGADGKFRPDDTLTREELCTIVSRIIEMKNISYEEKEISFTDEESISEWAYKGIKTMYSLNIVNGMDNGTFSPKSSATRAQTAVILNKMIKLIGVGGESGEKNV